MWKSVDDYVEKHGLIADGDRILIGLSGGADSVCLARYLLSVRESRQLSLWAVHVNHMLRGREALRDQEFVRAFCDSFALPLRIEACDVREYGRKKGCSLEEAGRQVRYNIFRDMAGALSCNKIAAAHHRGDQAETVLFHQIRGTGLSGLVGMRPCSGPLIRPLLGTGKEEILEYLKRLGQDYVEDSSNGSLQYHRNYIRHRILPGMGEVNPAAEDHLAALADQARDLFDYLKPMIQKSFEEETKLLLAAGKDRLLLKASLAGRARYERLSIIREGLFAAAGRQKDIGRVHIEQVDRLFARPKGKQIALPYSLCALKTGEGVVLFEKEDPAAGQERGQEEGLMPFCLACQLPDREESRKDYQEGNFRAEFLLLSRRDFENRKTDCDIALDYDRISGTVAFRCRRPHDYLIINRQGNRKLLKRYFIDKKIPAERRRSMLLLARGSHILWTEDGRVSEVCKVTEETKNILCIRIRKEGANHE